MGRGRDRGREREGEGERREGEGDVQCMNVLDHKITDNCVNSCGNIVIRKKRCDL